MKKAISMLLVAVMCCGMLAGCGKKKVETNDFDPATNKSHSIKGYSFDVPEKWEAGEENTDDVQYYFPEDGMLMVQYLELDGSVTDENLRKEFLDGFERTAEEYKFLAETEMEVDGEKAYQQEMNVKMAGKDLYSKMVLFDCSGGAIGVMLGIYQESDKDYSKDFEKILGTFSKPLPFEKTLDDVDIFYKMLSLGGEYNLSATDIGEGSDTPVRNWIDLNNGVFAGAVGNEEEKVTSLFVESKEEEKLASAVSMAVLGLDAFSTDMSAFLKNLEPEKLKALDSEPDGIIVEVIDGMLCMIRKSEGTYKYMFSIQRDKDTKADYEAYLKTKEK